MHGQCHISVTKPPPQGPAWSRLLAGVTSQWVLTMITTFVSAVQPSMQHYVILDVNIRPSSVEIEIYVAFEYFMEFYVSLIIIDDLLLVTYHIAVTWHCKNLRGSRFF